MYVCMYVCIHKHLKIDSYYETDNYAEILVMTMIVNLCKFIFKTFPKSDFNHWSTFDLYVQGVSKYLISLEM